MKPTISNFFIFVAIIGLLGLVFMHEQVHIEIYRSYGIESHINYFDYFPSVATVAEAPCPTDSCTLAHNINEAISYPLLVFYLIWALSVHLSLVLKEDII